MSKYRNNTAVDDSSVGSAFYREHPDDINDTTVFDENGVYLITMDDEGNRLCACGCLARVGPRAEFVQGHDARLKGILQRAYVRESDINVIGGGGLTTTDAWIEARHRGWQKFLTEYKARQERKPKSKTKSKSDPKPKTKEDKGEIVEAKVGRWTYTGVIIDGEFFYNDKNGDGRIAHKFTLV